MKANKPVVAVIGHTGMVGSTVFTYYTKKGYRVLGYSLDKQTGPENELNDADYVFECVPTPFNWDKSKYDMSIVSEVIEKVAKYAKKDSVVILKSTLLPGSTESIQKKYSDLRIIFNPEFLSEATAYDDFINPDRQIVGYSSKSREDAERTMALLPRSDCNVIMTATQAEIVKYVNNFNGALMIIMGNLIYDMCQKLGQDFEIVRSVSQSTKFAKAPFKTYWNIFHGGYRGYGGKCFPKDMQNLYAWMHEQNISCELLEATIAANKRLLEAQGLYEFEMEEIVRRAKKDEIVIKESDKVAADNILL